ncbi:hypothetical protein LCGC14_2885350, partial [marine sediment metagenome]
MAMRPYASGGRGLAEAAADDQGGEGDGSGDGQYRQGEADDRAGG